MRPSLTEETFQLASGWRFDAMTQNCQSGAQCEEAMLPQIMHSTENAKISILRIMFWFWCIFCTASQSAKHFGSDSIVRCDLV